MLIGGSIRRFDTLVILASLSGVTLLAWWYLFAMAADMGAMAAMPNMAIPVWDSSYALMMFTMWAVMMVGMMLPAVTPAVLIYQSITKKASREGQTVTPTGVFTAGYLLIWMLFSAVATAAQWGLDKAALLSPMLVSTSSTLGATLLIGAGIYQFLPIKNACLKQCRSPMEFLSAHWRTGTKGAFCLGAHHGLYCLGCCWMLMALLFFGGVMNLFWIALITIFVLVEKILPYGDSGGKVIGFLMIAGGGSLLFFGSSA